jgi:hypothetical protein
MMPNMAARQQNPAGQRGLERLRKPEPASECTLPSASVAGWSHCVTAVGMEDLGLIENDMILSFRSSEYLALIIVPEAAGHWPVAIHGACCCALLLCATGP